MKQKGWENIHIHLTFFAICSEILVSLPWCMWLCHHPSGKENWANCCSCWVTLSCLTLWDTMDCSMPGFHVPHHLLKFSHVHVHCTRDAIQPFHPLMPSYPSILYLSQHQRVFQWIGCSHQMTKILEFQLQHQSFQWIFRLISLKIDWFGLRAVQRTFRSLLQHHSLKPSILWCSAFFMVQLSQLYMTAGKTIAITIGIF